MKTSRHHCSRYYLLSYLISLFVFVPSVYSEQSQLPVERELGRLFEETHFLRAEMSRKDEALSELYSEQKLIRQRLSALSQELAHEQKKQNELKADLSEIESESSKLWRAQSKKKDAYLVALKRSYLQHRTASLSPLKSDSSPHAVMHSSSSADSFFKHASRKILFEYFSNVELELLESLREENQRLSLLRKQRQSTAKQIALIADALEAKKKEVAREETKLADFIVSLQKQRSAARELLMLFEAKALRLESVVAELQETTDSEDAGFEAPRNVAEVSPARHSKTPELFIPLRGSSLETFLAVLRSRGQQGDVGSTLFEKEGWQSDPPVVQAVLPGTVVYLGSSEKLGKVLILRHADELFSVYAGLQAAEVQRNESVQQGARLAQAKDSFLFELRRGSALITDFSQFQWFE